MKVKGIQHKFAKVVLAELSLAWAKGEGLRGEAKALLYKGLGDPYAEVSFPARMFSSRTKQLIKQLYESICEDVGGRFFDISLVDEEIDSL